MSILQMNCFAYSSSGSSAIASAIFGFTLPFENSSACFIAEAKALASELPCAFITQPFMPSSTAPPTSL